MHLLRNYVKSALARKPFQPFWRGLHKLSIYGMGYRLPDASLSGEDIALGALRREFSRRDGPSVIVDAGARYGEFTETFADDPRFRMHVFEPNPASMAVLSGKFGNAPNITLNQIALSDSEGETDLFDEGEAGSPFASTIRARLEAFGRTAQTTVRVRMSTLDAYFADIPGDIALLKLDIEGAEEAAMRGAAQLLRSRRIEMLFLEHSHVSAITGLSIYRLCALFSGFSIYRVIPGAVTPIRTPHKPYSPWDEVMAYCNLLIVRDDLALTDELKRYLGVRRA